MKKIFDFLFALLLATVLISCTRTVSCPGEGLVWEKYLGNPFDLRVDDASSPWIVYDGQIYRMWYTGVILPENVPRIYYATSLDGVNWTPYGIVLDRGSVGCWDESSVAAPVVLYDGTEYKMWYNGVGNPTSVWGMVGYANSSDGINWTKCPDNPVLIPGGNGGWDDWNIAYYSIMFNGTHFIIWYTGQQYRDSVCKIGVATSVDGINWTKYSNNPIIVPGAGEWEGRHVFAGPVIRFADHYEMWYSGQNSSVPGNRIGFATSIDGLAWSKYERNPVLGAGEPGSWDDRSVTSSCITEEDGRLLLWYTGADYTPGYSRIGLATSYIPYAITALGSTDIWVGLKNSDDIGIRFDLKAEIYRAGVMIGSGHLESVKGGSSGFNNAKLNSIPLELTDTAYTLPGDRLTIKLYVRNAASGSGKNSGTARLWYNDAQANSHFDATINGVPSNFYLLDNHVLGGSLGTGPKKTIDVAAGAKGSPFKLFGEWSITLP